MVSVDRRDDDSSVDTAIDPSPCSAAPTWNPTLPGFLLLPGDGLLLLDASGCLLWLDRDARRHLGAACESWMQQPLQQVWPELASRADALRASWSEAPWDLTVARPGPGGDLLQVRLFATDVGLGVGLLAPVDAASVSAPLPQLFAGLLNCVDDALLVTIGEPLNSPGPLIIFANETLLRESGYQRHELLGRSPRVLQGPATAAATTKAFGAQLRQWLPCSMEVLNYDRSGRARWVELKAAPLCDGSGWTTHWVAVQRDVTDRRMAEEALLREAITDPLTGLANRRALIEALDQQLMCSEGTGLALIFCDLNRFKEVNDRFGHVVGDALLCEISRRLSGSLRADEQLFRFGGDEFVVLASRHHAALQLDRLLERLQDSLRAPWQHQGEELSLSASMGVARCEGCTTADELLRRADSTMYEVKRRGLPQHGVAFYDPDRDRGVQRRVELRQQVERALRDQLLQLHGQPLVDLTTGRCLAVELLLRLQDPHGEFLDTQAVVAVAEECGLVQHLDAWVFRQAQTILLDWRSRGLRQDLAINVSPRSLEDWHAHPERLLIDADLQGLVIEVTETVLLQDLDQAVIVLDQFRRAGARIALDDFGSGFSSLSWLSRAPLDQVKIDRAVTRGLPADPRCGVTLTGFHRLFQDLGLQVVVEGIETESQREQLLALGFTTGQGYLFSRPLPLALLALDAV